MPARYWRSTVSIALTWTEVSAAAWEVLRAAMSVVCRLWIAVVESCATCAGVSDEIIDILERNPTELNREGFP